MASAPLPNRLIHVHGAVFTLWMVLLVVQIGLITGRKVRWHKTLGLAGFGLAVAMVVLGVLAAIDQMHRGDVPPDMDPKTFFVVPMTVISTFTVLVIAAYRMRFKAAAHKRLILIATIAISNAAIARWPIDVFQANPVLQVVVISAFLLIVMAYDLISLRRLQKTTLWASALVIGVMLVRIPLGMSHAWHVFAWWMGGKV
jgi:hypothetical protein